MQWGEADYYDYPLTPQLFVVIRAGPYAINAPLPFINYSRYYTHHHYVTIAMPGHF